MASKLGEQNMMSIKFEKMGKQKVKFVNLNINKCISMKRPKPNTSTCVFKQFFSRMNKVFNVLIHNYMCILSFKNQKLFNWIKQNRRTCRNAFSSMLWVLMKQYAKITQQITKIYNRCSNNFSLHNFGDINSRTFTY